MAISRLTLERLLDIVETFPGYFAGSSNIRPADCRWLYPDLTTVSGRTSYSYGAGWITSFTFSGFDEVEAGIEMASSVIRLGLKKEQLIEVG